MNGPTSASEWPDKSFGKELQAMFEAITELNLWDKVAQGPSKDKETGFMFSQDNWVDSIYNHPKVDACGHSGATQALCLRTMQHVVRMGWDAYLEACATAQAARKAQNTPK